MTRGGDQAGNAGEGVVVSLPMKAAPVPTRPVRPMAMTPQALDAFDTVAWRAPGSRRYDARPANDGHDGPSVMDELRGLPGWVVPVAGAAGAALMGLMVGGWLQL